MGKSSFGLLVVCIVSVLAGTEIWKDVDETVHIEYRSDTVLRFRNRHEGQDWPFRARQGGFKLLKAITNPDPGPGHVINCMTDKKSKMEITWTPKDVNISGSVTVTVDAVVPVEAGTINASLQAFLPGHPKPFAEFNKIMSCQQLAEKLPKTFKLSCPIQAGTPVKANGQMDLSPYSYQIPDGTFIIYARAENEKKEEIFCLNATITTYG